MSSPGSLDVQYANNKLLEMGLGMAIIIFYYIIIIIIIIKLPLYSFLSNLLVSAPHDQVPQHCPCVDSSSVTNGDEECRQAYAEWAVRPWEDSIIPLASYSQLYIN